MRNYADYNFYQNEFHGSLSNDLFSYYIVKASRVIDRNVNRKLTEDVINSLSEDEHYDLKYVACELTEQIKKDSGANQISIDGVSIVKKNYATQNEEKNEIRKILNNLPHELTRYL